VNENQQDENSKLDDGVNTPRPESTSGLVPEMGTEPAARDRAILDDGTTRAVSAASLSAGLAQLLETQADVEVIIEIADAGFLHVVFAELGQLVESGVSVQAFENAFPAPYLVAKLNAAQVDLISRVDGVLKIEENVVVRADVPLVDGVETKGKIHPLAIEHPPAGELLEAKQDDQ
jgi:hypothetical protein